MTTDTPARPIGRTDIATRLVLLEGAEDLDNHLFTFTAAGPNWRLSEGGAFLGAFPTFEAMVTAAVAHLTDALVAERLDAGEADTYDEAVADVEAFLDARRIR